MYRIIALQRHFNRCIVAGNKIQKRLYLVVQSKSRMNFLESYPFYSKNRIRDFFRDSGGAIRKRWGQNYIINPGTIDKIISSIEVKEKTQILEIGPGLGALTRGLLLKNLKVTAVEIDPVSTEILTQGFFDIENSPRIINIDALKFMDNLLNDNKFIIKAQDGLQNNVLDIVLTATDFEYICGNLPYYISSKLLQKIVLFPSLKKGCFLLQKEYADRIVKPGAASSFSVYLKNFGDWHSGGTVRAQNFYPVPKIDSSILVFQAHQSGEKADNDILEKVLRMSFAKKRKKLQNSWKQDKRGYLRFELLMDHAKSAGIDPQLRAEEIPEEAYFLLVNLIMAEL